MDYRRRGEPVVLADLDIVNPYFRTADFRDFAGENGIEIIASDYAGPNSSLDIPALTGRLDGRIGGEATLIIDVGGDDAGAMALGRYAERVGTEGYSMLYVINAYRYMVKEPGESVVLLREIETASRLRATHIVNCSNLGLETTAAEVRASADYARAVAEQAGLPVCCTAARREIAGELTDIQDVFPVEIYVTAPWNKGM